MKFVTLRSFDNYVQAHIVMGYLQNEHVNCWLKDEYSVTIDPMLTNAIGGIKLMVAEAQAGRAADIMQQLGYAQPPQYTCPQCGSAAVERHKILAQHRSLWKMFLAWFTGKAAGTGANVLRCANCGVTFSEAAVARAPLSSAID